MEGVRERGGGVEAPWAKLMGRTGASKGEDREGRSGECGADRLQPRLNWTCRQARRTTESPEVTHGGFRKQKQKLKLGLGHLLTPLTSLRALIPLFVSRSPSYEPCFPRYKPRSPSYDPNSPWYKLSSPSYDPISPRYEPRSPLYEPHSAHFVTHSPRPYPKTEARAHREQNMCLRPSHRPEAGYRDRPGTSSDASSKEDILTYSLGSEEEGNPREAVPPAKAGDWDHSRSSRRLLAPPEPRLSTQLGPVLEDRGI